MRDPLRSFMAACVVAATAAAALALSAGPALAGTRARAPRPAITRDATPTPHATTTISVAAPARWVVGKPFVVSGTLATVEDSAPASVAGQAVGLLQYRSGHWSRVASGVTDAHGRYKIRRSYRAPVSLTIRTTFNGDASATACWSKVRHVTVRYVMLRAVGDVNLGNGVATRIGAHGADYPWRKVGGYLKAADIAFANLECAISNRGSPEAKKYTFRGSRSSLRAMRTAAGIDVVSGANNHARDFGLVAFADTLANLRREKIALCGAGANVSAAHKPAFFTKDGLVVAFLGYSTIEDDRWRATRTHGGVASAFPVAQLKKDIRAAKAKADVVIVSFHWGIELRTSPESEQVMLGRAAIDAGAKVVLGHHPHCLQPITRYHGGLIDYSLGNFVFAPPSSPDINKQTLVLTANLSGGGLASYKTRRAYISDAQPHFTR